MAFLDEVRHLLKDKAGLDVSGVRDGQLERRVTNFMRRARLTEETLLSAVVADKDLLEKFLDGLTINVTSLFRNADRWTIVGPILKELGPRPRIWSAGCSKGAEAYTISIICAENHQTPSILATDIDARIMAKAVEGIYKDSEMREVDDAIKAKYFTRMDHEWRVDKKVASCVRFQHQDLLAGVLPSGGFDFIACRNVAIYFSREAKLGLHERLASTLNPGGYLFIGSTERVENPGDIGLTNVSPFIYQSTAELVRR
ncbi:MAG: protein-glutamate O-methyltransferase CheR [Acidimicrobiales bacterium]